MPVSRHVQTSLAAGEFDPLLWSREDVSFFYNSARIIENVVPLPQGGGKRREGWGFRALQRGEISQVDTSGVTASSTNGGTPANAIDGDEATTHQTATGINTATFYEIVRFDFGVETEVSLVDVKGARFVNLLLADGIAEWGLQISDDALTWTRVATFNVGNSEYDRRFGAAPDEALGSSRYWRIIVKNDLALDFGSATAAVNEVIFWTEDGYSKDGTLGGFSVHRLTSSIDNEYILWVTANSCDVFNAQTGAWVACVSVPHTDGQVGQVKNSPNLDTIILYHNDQPPWLIQRLGSDIDWRSNELQFDSVTQFPFEDEDVSGGENEIQFLRFDSMTAGDKLLVEYNGETSAEVTWNASEATNISALEAAIEGLEDITSVSVSVDSGTGVNAALLVEFDGVDGKKSWPILVIDILTGSGTVTVSRKQFGTPDKDALWSASRGYPSCGTFYQGRHWMGGFKARPDLIAASRAGSLFDFKEDADPVAGSPILVAPNIDDQVTVQNIYPGRHLQIFTSSAELYVPDEPITVNNIALKVTSRHGASNRVQPVDVQGGTLFIDRNGRALREYLFTDTEQSYSAEPVSLLAGHLISSPRSLVLRRARDVDEPTALLIANTGTDRNGDTVPAAICIIDRAQQVTGFCRISTQGTPLEFATTQSGEGFAVVERSLAGETWNFLEQFDADNMSDCSVTISGSGSTVDVSEYPWLEGQEVTVHGDGLPLGEFTVTGGEIDLGIYSFATEAEVGLRQVPRIVLHPYKGRGEISPTMQRQRIFRMLLQLERTGAVAVTASDGGRPRVVSLQNYDSGLMDPTLEELLYTGARRISGMGAWQVEPTVEITQIDPMPFLLRSITYDVRF